jgi:hypothetical protein
MPNNNNSPGVSSKDAGSISNVDVNVSSQTYTLVIGTSPNGPAFVPVGFSNAADFRSVFGVPNVVGSSITPIGRVTNYAPFGAYQWLQNQNSLAFMRVLGVGNGKRRVTLGTNAGDVIGAGFTVGENQPSGSLKALGSNPYANENGVPGRTYFLGCFMSESANSTFFNGAGLQGTGSVNGIGVNTSVPIVRGILMAPSGVILRLSASATGQDSSAPLSTQFAIDSSAKGATLGDVKLFNDNGASLQQFVILLNGHKGTEDYPNVITASFDIKSNLYLTRVLNTTASLIQEAGHYLAANWDIHPAIAVLTGSGVVASGAGSPSNSSRVFSTERSAFLLTSSLSRDVGSTSVPNYENFRDRFSSATTPWIISQKIHGKYINLFKLHSLSDGEQGSYKIIISNIKPASQDSEYDFCTFDIIVRSIYDFDETISALEKYTVSLDPKSDIYISKVIGDKYTYFDFDRPDNNQKLVVEGNYPNRSTRFRVEVSDEVSNDRLPSNILPMGFRGLPHIITSGSNVMAPLGGHDASALINSSFLTNLVVPPIPLTENIATFSNGTKTPSDVRRWGLKFDHVTNVEQQNNFYDANLSTILKHFPNHSTTNINFSVSDNQGTPDTSQLGIVDADRFCNNVFTLENIKITTGSAGYATKEGWSNAVYIRNGIISEDMTAKTRRVNVSDFNDIISRNYLTFQTSLYGGFDGTSIFDVDEFNMTDAAVASDMNDPNRGREFGPSVMSYLKALEIINDTTTIDTSLLAIPGIRAPIVTDAAINVAESRMDCLYLMDIEQFDGSGNRIDLSTRLPYDKSFVPDIQNTINEFDSRSLNTSYAAAYYPDVELKIDENLYGISTVIVPATVAALGAFSVNDTQSSFSAPAGNSRGAALNVLSTVSKLKKSDENSLYEKNINYLIASNTSVGGEQTGIIVQGQKTLGKSRSSLSSLSRINVRRMLLEARRRIRVIAMRLLFDPNRDSIVSKFVLQAGDALSSMQSSFGLENYKIEIDASTTTQNDIDNNTIRGKIYIKPAKSIDYVSINYIVSNKLQSEV